MAEAAEAEMEPEGLRAEGLEKGWVVDSSTGAKAVAAMGPAVWGAGGPAAVTAHAAVRASLRGLFRRLIRTASRSTLMASVPLESAQSRSAAR